jgi:DNA recombination protein Rad52
MSFTDDQIASLKAPLDRAKVKSRAQAGRNLSYIEGWHAIAEANRIFGFDSWDRETVDLRECGEPRQVGDKWRVAFMCRVRVKVRPANQMDLAWSVVRDGTGYGSGIDKDLGQAYESAIKEAETDAMKRALMTFGNPFGLALYDKDQTNVADMRQTRQSDRHINEEATQDDEPSWSQMAAQSMADALLKRAGPAAVEAFLARDQVKDALSRLDMDDHTWVMRIAAERRAVEPVTSGVAA